jgi:hypothetical protein
MLAYWEQTDVYYPSYEDDKPHRPYRRIYSFSDVVSLRTLATLRRKHNVKLDELRKTGQYLRHFDSAPWTRRFWVQGGRVLFQHPSTAEIVDRVGQTTYVFDVEQMRREIEVETERWNERDPGDIGQLARHRHVQRNQWVIKGTRIPTSAVWSFHLAGYDVSGIIREYPSLTVQDVESALKHERDKHLKAA